MSPSPPHDVNISPALCRESVWQRRALPNGSAERGWGASHHNLRHLHHRVVRSPAPGFRQSTRSTTATRPPWSPPLPTPTPLCQTLGQHGFIYKLNKNRSACGGMKTEPLGLLCHLSPLLFCVRRVSSSCCWTENRAFSLRFSFFFFG